MKNIVTLPTLFVISLFALTCGEPIAAQASASTTQVEVCVPVYGDVQEQQTISHIGITHLSRIARHEHLRIELRFGTIQSYYVLIGFESPTTGGRMSISHNKIPSI